MFHHIWPRYHAPEMEFVGLLGSFRRWTKKFSRKVPLAEEKSVIPAKLPLWQIPLAVQEDLSKDLTRLEILGFGVIIRETRPTDWVFSLMVASMATCACASTQNHSTKQ